MLSVSVMMRGVYCIDGRIISMIYCELFPDQIVTEKRDIFVMSTSVQLNRLMDEKG